MGLKEVLSLRPYLFMVVGLLILQPFISVLSIAYMHRIWRLELKLFSLCIFGLYIKPTFEPGRIKVQHSHFSSIIWTFIVYYFIIWVAHFGSYRRFLREHYWFSCCRLLVLAFFFIYLKIRPLKNLSHPYTNLLLQIILNAHSPLKMAIQEIRLCTKLSSPDQCLVREIEALQEHTEGVLNL